ncbi:hypothetical protein Syun_018633 [Stephania yunnanensis]|uniref:Uncharacterized protein n=1 Tax=Stephania yunnanensis TaxID=152371 RepID=A0AAP0NYK7_9MAGN
MMRRQTDSQETDPGSGTYYELMYSSSRVTRRSVSTCVDFLTTIVINRAS